MDDEPDVLEFFRAALDSDHYEIASSRDGDEALETTAHFQPQIVFLDIRVPGQDGWLVCSKLKNSKRPPQIVLITGEMRPDLDRFAQFVHADLVLRKPFSADDIDRALDHLAHQERKSA